MTVFQSALKTVLDRRYTGKIAALSAASDMHGTEIGRLINEESPLTAAKLDKLLNAQGMTPGDIQLLSHAAIRDFVGDQVYRQHFIEPTPETHLREDIGGPSFQSLFPLSPRAEQVLRYIIAHAHEPDTTTALELLGKFLELPLPTVSQAPPLQQPTGTHYRLVALAEEGERLRRQDKAKTKP